MPNPPQPPRERSAPPEKVRAGQISGRILLVLTLSLALAVVAAIILYGWYYGFSGQKPL